MAAKKGSKKAETVAVVTLAEIVAATLDSSKGFLYTAKTVYEPLVKDGLAEINEQMTNEAGEVATRATDKGVQQMSNSTPAETTAVAAAAGFVIESGIPMPSISGRGRANGSSKYPFDKLEVNQSFFVPASDACKEPGKTLASTVARANMQYSEVVEGETKKNRKGEDVPMRKQIRQFVLRTVEGGARVWRTL